jgi:hypothetical protein
MGLSITWNKIIFFINAILKARQILDHCVTLPIAKHKPTIMTSQNNLSCFTYSHACKWVCCDCMWTLKGNICKHQTIVPMILHQTWQRKQWHISMKSLRELLRVDSKTCCNVDMTASHMFEFRTPQRSRPGKMWLHVVTNHPQSYFPSHKIPNLL